MKRQISPIKRFGGVIRVPGDKSIAHRAALLSILAHDKITVRNFPDNADCASSLRAATAFGVRVESSSESITLTPPEVLSAAPDTIVDCGNSGTTARLLSGIVAGSDLTVTLAGDESLSRRPMKRIIDPLSAMGAELFADNNHLPMKIAGRKLLPYEYRLPVASAQVKSAVLLAGLASSCSIDLKEDSITRDHTERMIAELGGTIEVREVKPILVPDPIDPRKKRQEMPADFKKEIRLASNAKLTGGVIDIPGDISTAAFFLAAAAISKQTITIENLGLNPTRIEFLDHLRTIGCAVEIRDRVVVSNEPRGTVTVTGGQLKSRKIGGETVIGMIDEIPILAVMAAFADGTTLIRDASELRVKESDRLTAVADNLRAMGVKCGVLEDGLAIEGGKELPAADFKSFGDHRIAMAFSIAGLFLVGPSTIDDDSVVGISCPNFYELLQEVTG